MEFGAISSTVSGANVIVQSLGGVDARVTPVSGAVPVLLMTRLSVVGEPAVTRALRRPSDVSSAMLKLPVISTVSWVGTLIEPLTAFTTIGYSPAAALAGGSTVAWTSAVEPASTVAVAACVSPVGRASTVQPAGASLSKPKVCCVLVWLLRVRPKRKVEVVEPQGSGSRPRTLPHLAAAPR